MKKIFSLLAAVLFAGSMMAAEAIMQYTGGVTANMVGDGANNAATLGLDATLFSVTAEKGATSNLPGLNKANDIRLYAERGSGNGNIITVSIASGTITSIVLDIKQTATFVVKAGETAVTEENGAYAINATSFSIQNTTTGVNTQLQLNKITITYTAGEGGEPSVEPGDEPVAQTVLFKAENVAVSEASVIAANTALVDDDLLKVENMYESFLSGTSHTYVVTPEHSIEFQKALQVRASTYPAGEDLIGENNNSASTADNKKASPLVLTAKEDVEVIFYYRRQSSNTVVGDAGESVTHDQNDGKDLIVYDQADIATKMVTEYYALADAANEEYAFAVKGFKFKKDHVYTLTAKGTTLPLFGFEYAVAQPDEPVLADPTNCAEAAEAALSVAANNELYNDGKEYTIEGYVTAIQTAFSATNKNITFWMADAADGGKVLEAYRAACETAEDAPAVGDKVAVTGKLTKYNSTPEFAAGCTFVIIEKSAPAVNLGEKTIAEFLALKNIKDTCVLTGVVDSIANTTYGNLYLVEGTDTLYVYGVLTPAGESKKFGTLGVAVGDKLTIKAVYSEYNGKPQASNAIFVSVEKAMGIENIELTEKARKVIVDGVIYIVRDGKMFNLQGTQVR